MPSYLITSYDVPGSLKPQDHGGNMQNLELPEGAKPIGFDVIITEISTGNQYIAWSFPDVQREWIDKEHTEFICNRDGMLRRFKVITRVYCSINGKVWEESDTGGKPKPLTESETRKIHMIKDEFIKEEGLGERADYDLLAGAGFGIKLNPEAYIGTNIKEGTIEITMHIQHSEMPFSNLHDLQAKPQKYKYLVVLWKDKELHEMRFPIYLLEDKC